MYFSKPQENTQTSFSLLEGASEQETRRKRVQDRNQIRVNRKKLPSDFFKRSGERSLSRKYQNDEYAMRFSNPRTAVLIKQPQTERKIPQIYDLLSTENHHGQDFTLSRTEILRLDDHKKNFSHRRMLVKQINTSRDQYKDSRQQNSTECVKTKSFRGKQSAQNLEIKSELRNLIKQRIPKKNNAQVNSQPKQPTSQIIEMGCTFGKGFKNHGHVSLECSIMLKDQTQPLLECPQGTEKDYRYKVTPTTDKQSMIDKSTEQSQITTDCHKSDLSSPIRTTHGRKLFILSQQTPHFQHPKTTRIHWNIHNHDMQFFQDLSLQSLQKSKQVFTAEQKQRRTRYRANNSSNQYREKTSRKDKQMEGWVKLPRIGGKVSSLSGDDGQV